SEYYRISRDAQALDVAFETWRSICRRVEDPAFNVVAPYQLPLNRRFYAVSMIFTEISNELAQTTGDASIDAAAGEYAARILDHHVRPEYGLLVEFLDRSYNLLPPNEGTAVMPGHAIESMWFVIHWARRHN